jgi:hypothetical protein
MKTESKEAQEPGALLGTGRTTGHIKCGSSLIIIIIMATHQHHRHHRHGNNNFNNRTPKTMSIILCITIIWMTTSITLFLYNDYSSSSNVNTLDYRSLDVYRYRPISTSVASTRVSTAATSIYQRRSSSSSGKGSTSSNSSYSYEIKIDPDKKTTSILPTTKTTNNGYYYTNDTTNSTITNQHDDHHHHHHAPQQRHQQRPPPPPPTIVLQLRGEMGNHLSGLAHAKGLQWDLEEHYFNNNNNNINLPNPTTPQLILRHQTKTQKWQSTRTVLRQCFPNIAALHFEQGNTPEFATAKGLQKEWFKTLSNNNNNNNNNNKTTITMSTNTTKNNMRNGEKKNDPYHALIVSELEGINGRQYGSYRVVDAQQIEAGLTTFQTLWRQEHSKTTTTTTTTAPKSPPQQSSTTTTSVSIPFLLSHTLGSNYMVNRYYDKIVDFFRFNETACCGPETPYPDETVFVSTVLLLFCFIRMLLLFLLLLLQ